MVCFVANATHRSREVFGICQIDRFASLTSDPVDEFDRFGRAVEVSFDTVVEVLPGHVSFTTKLALLVPCLDDDREAKD